MKKILFATLCILVFASFCYAAADEVVGGQTRAKSDFVSGDSYITYVYVSDSADASDLPTHIVTADVNVWVGVHAGMTQTYFRHYMITDSAGTLVDYDMVSGDWSADTFHNLGLPFTLPIGDYTFTFVAAGGTSGMAVADQVRFSVR